METHSTTMIELQFDGTRLPLDVQRVSAVQSPHTGRSLIELHTVTTTSERADHDRLVRALRDVTTRTVRSVEPWEHGVVRWRVSWNSYAESGGVRSYMLILQEDEELSLRALVVDNVELHPYEYREEISDEGELTIWAKLVGSKTQVFRLRALLNTQDPFPVVRHGIQNEPRSMRFGVAEWSEHEGRIKVRLVLVDRDAHRADHPEVLRIARENQQAAVAFYMNFVERLADVLETRGLLSAAEIEAAREAAREAPWQARQEFWRVPDVDQR